jgi:hypothetical protein
MGYLHDGIGIDHSIDRRLAGFGFRLIDVLCTETTSITTRLNFHVECGLFITSKIAPKDFRIISSENWWPFLKNLNQRWVSFDRWVFFFCRWVNLIDDAVGRYRADTARICWSLFREVWTVGKMFWICSGQTLTTSWSRSIVSLILKRRNEINIITSKEGKVLYINQTQSRSQELHVDPHDKAISNAPLKSWIPSTHRPLDRHCYIGVLYSITHIHSLSVTTTYTHIYPPPQSCQPLANTSACRRTASRTARAWAASSTAYPQDSSSPKMISNLR